MQKRIAHITDTHLDDRSALDRGAYPRKNLELLLEDARRRGIDDIVFTGDMGEIPTYGWLFDKFKATGLPYKVILGNHDTFNEAVKYYSNYTTFGNGELYYTSEDDVYRYIFLDSSSSIIGIEQLAWFEKQLITSKKIILFIHHPVLSIDTAVDKLYPLHNREKINELLQQCENKITIFCGHYHMPDKRVDRNIVQYVTPSVAFQIKKDSPVIDISTNSFGYRLITITDDNITGQLIINRNNTFLPEPG